MRGCHAQCTAMDAVTAGDGQGRACRLDGWSVAVARPVSLPRLPVWDWTATLAIPGRLAGPADVTGSGRHRQPYRRAPATALRGAARARPRQRRAGDLPARAALPAAAAPLPAPTAGGSSATCRAFSGAASPSSTTDLPAHVDRSRYPRYYLRTFHWQTDGWLSERSARLYDPSVEFSSPAPPTPCGAWRFALLRRALRGVDRPRCSTSPAAPAASLLQLSRAPAAGQALLASTSARRTWRTPRRCSRELTTPAW